MFLKFFFGLLSITLQVNFVKKRGIILGTRLRCGRQVYIYMYGDLFAEVQYEDDDPEKHAERLILVSGLENLNHHLEKEIKSSH